MKTIYELPVLVIVIFIQCTPQKVEKPPLAPVKPVTDNYFGTQLIDYYQYMENTDDSVVMSWLKSNGDYARSVFGSMKARQRLLDKMYEFDSRNTSTISYLQITENDKYFYLKTTPDDDTGKLFYRDGLEGAETLLFDPETYQDDPSVRYVINNIVPSHDGGYVAFGVTPNGKELATVYIIKVGETEPLPDKVDQVLGINSWLPDNAGILYIRTGSENVMDSRFLADAKTMLHKLNSVEPEDEIFFSREMYPDLGIEPNEIPVATFDKESGLLFGLASSVDNRQRVFYAPGGQIGNKSIQWKPLFILENEIYNWYANETDIYFYTPLDAPNFKLMKTSVSNPDINSAVTVIPEDKEQKLSGFTLTRDGIYYTMKKNGVQAKLYFKAFEAETPKEIDLPFPAGTITLGSKGSRFHDVWVTMHGYTQVSQRFRYDVANDECIPENLSVIPEYPEFRNLVLEEVMVKSHDGVEVPLSIIYNKGIKKNGSNPLLLYGYGAYGISMEPYFLPNILIWCLEGGIYAEAHVRGGGELGDKWHKGGFKTTKPNTWKDFIACAEYIIENQYTSPAKIAIYGVSAGGILIGRAMTERPDLFAAAIPAVGLMNAVRTEFEPSGPVNIPEFGTVKDSVEFLALLEMDAYHNLKEGVNYPATLITGGMNDPRVVIWNPGKFAARMQGLNETGRPLVFKVDYEAGHGLDNTKSKNFEEMADILSFALWNTGNRKYKPAKRFL